MQAQRADPESIAGAGATAGGCSCSKWIEPDSREKTDCNPTGPGRKTKA